MPSKKKAKGAAKKSKASVKRAAKPRAAARPKVAAKRAARPAKRKAATKAAPRKAAAKKAAPRKAVAAKKGRAAARKAPVRGTAVRRRDRAGHIDPKYARELIEKSEGREPSPESFLERPRSRDDLAEQLGEEFVEETTGGEHQGEDVLDQEVPEEVGGPFVESSAGTEFARGTDPSNPKSATKEPFPRT
jgi:hypothetical protein